MTAAVDLPLLPLLVADVPEGLERVLRQEGIPAVRFRPGAKDGRLVVYDSRRTAPPKVARGQVVVDMDPLRCGFAGDPFAVLLDAGSRRAAWAVGPVKAVEEIARVDKRAIRRAVVRALQSRIEAAGGIWLRLAVCPFPYRTAMNFRIDYDEYDAADFRATMKAVVGHEQATSHFVCGSAYRSAADALARLRGLDVGSHGYWHHTYRTAEENIANIARGIDVLLGAGIEPSGFVAPHGRWNAGLAEALERLPVGHSSEFGLAYDDLPFWPGRADVLQIPVHPVSLGIVLEAAAGGRTAWRAPQAADLVVEYFCRYADLRYRLGEPVFLYGHPTRRLGRYPHVLAGLLEHVGGLSGVWKTTLSEFARWWRFRAAVRVEVRKEGEQLVVRADRPADRFVPVVECCRGELVARLPLEGGEIRFSLDSLTYQRRPTEDLPRPVPVRDSGGLRAQIRRLVDWETVTPVCEIRPNGLRNWAKRTLRRVLVSRKHGGRIGDFGHPAGEDTKRENRVVFGINASAQGGQGEFDGSELDGGGGFPVC